MSNMIKIFDPTLRKWRDVMDIHIASYDSGRVAQMTVIGRAHNWCLFIPLRDFNEANPEIALD